MVEVHSNERENSEVYQCEKEYAGRPLVIGEAFEQWRCSCNKETACITNADLQQAWVSQVCKLRYILDRQNVCQEWFSKYQR